MPNILPANRVAAIATWLSGFGAFIASIEGAIPGKWQSIAVAISGLALQAAAALHYMTGSQKHDALVAKTPNPLDLASDLAVQAVPLPAENAPIDAAVLEHEVAGLADPGEEIAPAP